jgi:hypothetical protein
MRCPNCGLFKPSISDRCHCGYDFAGGAMKESGLSPPEAAREPLSGERRILLGFMAQPFVTALLGFLLFPFLAITDPRLHGTSPGSLVEVGFISGMLIGLVGLLITVCAAAPVFYWLRGRGPVTWRHAVISALLFANTPTTLLFGLISFHGRDPRLSAFDAAMIAVRVILLSSCIGAVSASIFWWIATGDLRASLSTDTAESSLKRSRIT